MKQNTIKEIIDLYIKSDVPEQIKTSFETWVIDAEDSAAKNRALVDSWESFETPEAPGTYSLPSAAQIIEGASGRNIRRKRFLRYNLPLWLSSAAAVFLAVICINQLIHNNKTVTCLASSDSAIARYVLPDGTKVWLNRNSRMYYSGNLDGKSRTVTLEGEVYLDVAEDKEHPFVVKAQDLEIEVLGTEFTVSAYDDNEVSVYLQEGCVNAKGPGFAKGVTLTPNQSLTYNKTKGSYVKEEVRASNHTSWIGKRLVFNSASLYDIMESMSHWYQMEISCNDEAFAKSTHLSLTIRQEPITEILESIEMFLPVTYTEVNENTIILMHNNNNK